MSTLPLNIGFIGAGKMAEALIGGLIFSKIVAPHQIFASDVDAKRRRHLKKYFHIQTFQDNLQAAKNATVIILAVKPQVMNNVLEELKNKVSSKQIIISIAAGITLKKIEKYFPASAVIRVMPNNPALVKEAMSVICLGRFAKEKERNIAQKIFSRCGKVLFLPEKYLNAVTALSGSSPAFIYKFLEALIKAGEKINLSSEISKILSYQTFFGAAKMLKESGKTPQELIAMVKSSRGTTEAGLKVLEKKGFSEIIEECLKAALKRAAELALDYSRGS